MKQTPLHAHFNSKKPTSRKRKQIEPKLVEEEQPAVPELSERTKQLLASLEAKRPARPPSNVDEILHSTPAQEKYKDLLKPGRHLNLPVHYKKLLNSFEATELTLSYLKRRKVIKSFEAVQKDVETLHKHKYTLQDLQQMLTVLPDCYVVAWINAPGPTLVMDFPNSTPDIEARKTEFQNRLLDIVRFKHSQFLKTLPSKPQVDPANYNVWHHAFDLHNLPDIELTPLPPQPQPQSIKVEELIVPEAEITQPSSSKFSAALMAKIEAQAAASRMRKAELARDDKASQLERLLSLAEVLKAVYASQKEPSCFVSELVRKIKSSPKCFSSEQEVEEDIKKLAMCLPEWLVEVKTRSGLVLRMNRKQEMLHSQLKESLQAKL